MLLHVLADLPVALGGGFDAEGTQQVRGRRARIVTAELRMQSAGCQMVKNQIDDAPRVERLASLVHGLSPCLIGVIWGLNMRQSETTQRVTCNRDVTKCASNRPRNSCFCSPPPFASAYEEPPFVDGAEPLLLEDNRKRLAGKSCSFSELDITLAKPEGTFDAAYSLDVIEHIPADREHLFFENICSALERTGVFIMGTPNVTASPYASEGSRIGHINLKSNSDVRALMSGYFEKTILPKCSKYKKSSPLL